MKLIRPWRIACIILLSFHSAIADERGFYYGTFPKGFIWGTSTSSYQIEGAWNIDGKGLNIWDTFTHMPGNVVDNSTGDVACNSYYKYEEDVKLLKSIGVSHYRFSISWARILPNGTGEVNAAGISYYNRLIDALKSAGIEPMVTLYHWDLPKALEDVGGWTNDSIIAAFKEYARVCFTNFGNRVKMWITLNEPLVFVWYGYGTGLIAPGIKHDPGRIPYIVAHNVIRAHAHAWHLYDEEFRSNQKGLVSITLGSDWKEPYNISDPAHMAAAKRDLEFRLGWFANPIYGNGDYPEIMRFTVAENSRLQNLSESRLPAFTEEEKIFNKGTYDFFGLDHYTTQFILHRDANMRDINYENDIGTEDYIDPSWPESGTDWLKVVPWGMRKVMVYIKEHYGNPPLIVTENGVSDRTGALNDDDRIVFYRNYTNEMLKAINKDGCDVRGYFAWSLMDNFEWINGYIERFGLHSVDFKDPERPRTPKESAKFYRQLIKDNGFKQRTQSGASKNIITTALLAILTMLFIYAAKRVFRS